jgi:hypothetical protein
MTKPNVISLIHFSDDQQVDDDRAGVPGQRLRIDAGVAFHHLNVLREVIVIDVSGQYVADDSRFQEIFRDLKSGAADGVIVAEQSRLVRPQHWADFAVLDHFKRNRRLIWTPTECIDPNTQAGWYTLTVGGMVSGGELQNMVDRFQRGKKVFHLSGRHASSDEALPRGVQYVRTRDPRTGKTVAWRWQHDGFYSERMKKAFGLLVSTNLSFEAMAAEVGGYTRKGLKESLQNPIWIGLRRFQWKGGEEYTPMGRGGKPGKKRRRQFRIEPTLVPIDIPHLVSDEVFQRTQEIIAERALAFRKSKERNAGRQRFLANGLLRCPCGDPLYTRYGGRGSHLDAYHCASTLKGAGGCGVRSFRRDPVDQTIRHIITERLLDLAFLRGMLAAVVKKAKQPTDAGRAKREAALAKLEKGRKELVLSMAKGDITRTEFKEDAEVIDREIRDLKAMLPALPVPDADAKHYLEAITHAFAEFGLLPFAEQREILRRAIKEIVIDGRQSPSIPSLTLNGGFLGGFKRSGCGANSTLPSRPQETRRLRPIQQFAMDRIAIIDWLEAVPLPGAQALVQLPANATKAPRSSAFSQDF